MRAPPAHFDGPARRKLRAGLALAAGGLLVLYPLLVYFGVAHLGLAGIAVVLIAVAVLRLVALKLGSADRAFGAPQAWLLSGGAIALAVTSLWSGSGQALLYYPVLVNGALLLVFGASLFFGPTVVERIARWHDRDLPAAAVPYLRRVTFAWCLFFVGNGAIALYTAMRTSFATWTLYNGFLAYLLIGAMFGGELLTRRRAMRKARG